jgi:hypothetical protein
MQRTTTSGSTVGSGSPPLAAGPHDPLRHVSGREEYRIVGVEPRSTRREGGGRHEDLTEVDAEPADVPGADRLGQQPQAHDVAQVSDRAVHTAFVGEVRRPALLGEHGCLQFDTDEAPGAAGDVAEVRACGGDTDDGGGGVVRAHRGHQQLLVDSQVFPRGRGDRRQNVPGFDDVGQQFGGQTQCLDQLRRPPAGAGVEQAGGGGVGGLGGFPAGEPVTEQVRDQQRPVASEVGLGGQLVEGVEGQELQPVHGVKLGRFDLGVDVVDDRFGAGVAVVARVARQCPVSVEQPVVDGSGVDRDTG